jgi:hypothetical protein
MLEMRAETHAALHVKCASTTCFSPIMEFLENPFRISRIITSGRTYRRIKANKCILASFVSNMPINLTGPSDQ